MSFEKELTNVGEVFVIVVRQVARFQDNGGLRSHVVLNGNLVTLREHWEVFVVSHESVRAELDGEDMLTPEAVD
jgi:hypothetical protein